MMRKQLLFAITLVAVTSTMPTSAAVHHSKRANAYFEQHEKCRQALKTAKNEARKHHGSERKEMLRAAHAAYERCEAYANLVWKYYPDKPLLPDPTATAAADSKQ
jgi:hypothetical protein